jgi:predicted aminopeptidase
MIRWLLLVVTLPLLTGCDSIAYYAQAVQGQAGILLGREPIQQLLDDPTLDPRLREQLQLVESARNFAEQELGLDAAGSFTTYVDPKRQHIVWNVFAAPWNSVELINWCFPIAGCVAYRGYFSEQAARQYAQGLSDDGYDVYVGGVDIYSTLGWFNDPLPATVLRRADYQLAGLIFHELSHQRIYVPGDTRFNESFASFVEQQGLQRWLELQGQPQQFADVRSALQAQQSFADFVMTYRGQLRALYAAPPADADELEQQKQQLFLLMQSDWQARPDANRYRQWFTDDLNNAKLATVATYFDWVPAFEQLYVESGSQFEGFYLAVEALTQLPTQQRLDEIERLQSLRLQNAN